MAKKSQFRRVLPASFTGDVTTKLAGDDWGRGWVSVGSSLLLVLILAPRVFLRVLRFSSLSTEPTLLILINSHARTLCNELKALSSCYVGKQITFTHIDCRCAAAPGFRGAVLYNYPSNDL